MTETLHVGRLHVRYRLPEDDAATRRRLDALLERVLEEELEPALLRRGVPVGEEVCVGAVDAPARVRLAAGAGAAGEWGEAIADAIAAAVVAGGPGVVRYRSRAAALADLTLSVAEGRLERVWAWRRLGLWRGGDSLDPHGAAAEVVSALAAEPERIVAVFAHAARGGALPRLLALIDAGEWVELARAALAAAGAAPGVATFADDARPARPPAARATDVAARVVRSSALARALRATEPRLPAETAVALAALAWLEADPAAASAAPYAEAADVVRAVARLLVPGAAAPEAEPDPAEDASPPPDGADGPEDVAGPNELHSEPDEAEPDDARSELDEVGPALTCFAGLLFLLGVLDELGVPAEVQRSPSLGGRPLRWTLHRLALTLVPAAADDPAALAFAGLPPDAPPPDDREPASDDELLGLGVLAARVAERARELLDRPEATPDEVLDFVCRRRGELAFDPGWLEVRLPLDEVSVELRRAGLDLDPGWIPWLGCVVRFVYG